MKDCEKYFANKFQCFVIPSFKQKKILLKKKKIKLLKTALRENIKKNDKNDKNPIYQLNVLCSKHYWSFQLMIKMKTCNCSYY